MPMEVEYPDWVYKHLTPEFEVTTACDPGKVELWFECQRTDNLPIPIGADVYEAVKSGGLLERSLSLGHLKWFEQNPGKVPSEFRGKAFDAWASVVRSTSGKLYVPCLYYYGDRPFVAWDWLGSRWSVLGFAGLREVA